MGKYVLKPNDPSNFITVDIYVRTNTDGSYTVLSMDEESKLDKANLPKEIVKESATFLKKKSFGVANMMEEDNYIEIPDPRQGEPDRTKLKLDFTRMQLNKIKYLLKDWTLKLSDPEMTLRFVNIKGTNIQIIDPVLVQQIDAGLCSDILNTFLFRYDEALRKGESALKN